MLLACCFQRTKKKKHKKNKTWRSEQDSDNEDTYVLSQRLLSSSIISTPITKPVFNTKTADIQESKIHRETKFQTQKYAKLENDREELKLQRRDDSSDFACLQRINTSTPLSKAPQNRISSLNFKNISTVHLRKEPQLVPKDVSRMFASAEDLEGSNLSISNSHQTIQSSNQSLVSYSSQQTYQVEPEKTPPVTGTYIPTARDGDAASKNENQTEQRNFIIQVEERKRKSSDLHETVIQMIHEELTSKTEENKDFLRKLREESELKIEDLKVQHKNNLQKAKESFDDGLLKEREKNRKYLETLNISAKNDANETISKLNELIVSERTKVFAEQKEKSRNFEFDFIKKEDQMNQSKHQLENREQVWQDEKAEVLSEVQRLKAEATRMVKILGMEYDEENSNEFKRRSLSQEVYSLQLVVEMKTGEARKLREQLNRATQQLEDSYFVDEKLAKATARIEDLQEQLEIKKMLEKKLSLEKYQLELDACNTTKTADRMSRNVEALQWRIRNNFDLPVDNLTPVTCEEPDKHNQMTSLPAFFADQEKYCEESFISISQSSFPKDKTFENIRRETSSLVISEQLIEATYTSDKNKDNSENKAFDGYNPNVTEDVFTTVQQSNYSKSRVTDTDSDDSDMEVKQVYKLNEDIDSNDEGVGDISSDGYNPDSPMLHETKFIITNNKNINIKEEKSIRANEAKTFDTAINNTNQTSYLNRVNSSVTSPVKERIPSRFSVGH